MRYVLAQGKNKQYGVYDTTKKQLVYEPDSFAEALQTAIDKIEGE